VTGDPDPRVIEHLERVKQLSTPERLHLETELVAPYVDRAFYASVHGRAVPGNETPERHFCRSGWQNLLKPRRDFDVWWYWANHLDPGSSELNPLVHYALAGRADGLTTRPEPCPEVTARLSESPRRACLFAAFDQDGIVDATTVRFIAELARHSDVFVLYDGYVAPAELAKLDGIATGAWAVRHGAYDFGSYSMLARDLVGWERLAAYDEVLFVNDSCFLVRELDDVFATMDRRDCSWWGLQATKGLASTRHQPSSRFIEPVPLADVHDRLLATFEDDAVYDFHLGSYFLAFRRPVLADEQFRRLVGSVAPEPSKLLIILKYEIGLTHLLLGRGYAFDTYVPMLHPFHPLFTATHFTLLNDGFPLLKRYLIYQNHYDVPGMHRWKERVLKAAPDAPVDEFERLLVRTAPDDRLQRSYAIRRRPDGTVKVPRVAYGAGYQRRDEKQDKQDDLWVFAVDPATHTLPASSRALLEAVKDDGDIRKVILTRSRRLALSGASLDVEPLLSPAGRRALLSAGRVFVAGEPWPALSAPVSAERQLIVAVRRGLHLEKSGRAASTPAEPLDDATARGPRAAELAHPEPARALSGMVVASDVDALAALACTWPARYRDTWRTGIPAHDFLFCPEERLPIDLRDDVRRLRAELDGRRLLLFLPSLRRTGTDRAPYVFGDAERAWLRDWCQRQETVLGLREPGLDLERPYSVQLGDQVLDLSVHRYPSLTSVLRVADAVLTDHADSSLDFAVTGRPVLGFLPDLDAARDRLLYDPEHFFPGPVARDFEELTAALDGLFTGADVRGDLVRDLLVDRRDDQNTARLLAKLASLNGGTP
jgi:hypothetical protein